MRDNVKNLAKLIGETVFLAEPVVEIGSFQVPSQEEYADMRPSSRKEYIGCDMRPGPGVDRVENVENSRSRITPWHVAHARHFWSM
jgi:hypothetical protein